MKILCFVFSWKGQYQNAVKLEEQLSPLVDKLYVINSDDDNTPEHWINIGNQCYFSDQFRKALEISRSEDYDVFCQVCSDVSYSDWGSVFNSARNSFIKEDCAVYAPNVDDTFYIGSRTDCISLEGNLKIVANTDELCWFIKKELIQLTDKNSYLMQNNQLGWGWDLIICGYAHLHKMKVIRDYNYTISHPPSTGYKKDEAETEMIDMFNKCPRDLQEIIYRIKTSPASLANIYRPKSVFVYNT